MSNYVAIDCNLKAMTTEEFVEVLRSCNEEKRDAIKVGRGIHVVVYSGGEPSQLNPPTNFTWNEAEGEFNDLEAHLLVEGKSMCQYFKVIKGDNT